MDEIDEKAFIILLGIIGLALLVLCLYACVAVARDIDDNTYYEKGVDSDVDCEETNRSEGEYQ
jgi:hypothetical protein